MNFARRITPLLFHTCATVVTICFGLHGFAQTTPPPTEATQQTTLGEAVAKPLEAKPQEAQPQEAKPQKAKPQEAKQLKAKSPLEAAERYYLAADLPSLNKALRDLQRFWPEPPSPMGG